MLLIVGLDGASLDLTHRWADAGHLPHLARLFGGGAWGLLRSTMPPATFPAWTTFTTGVNPGRHGIFDFTRRVPGNYAVEFVNASYRKAPTVWSRLSAAGKRVAVFGIPGTYPPEPINGHMISGFDTPVTVRADASFAYPPELARELEANGGFPFADFQEFRVDRAWHRDALHRLLDGIATKTRFAVRQLHRERWDCAMILYGESDTVAHHFWRFGDPESPRFDADGAHEFGSAIRSVYAALDKALGELIEAAQPEAVLVCSDHGFGGAGSKIVHLNRQLERAGLLRRRQRGAAAQIAGLGKRWLLRHIPAGLQARCFRFGGGRLANTLESMSRFAAIDWAATRAFSEELNYFPSVWLNVKGRDPMGTVSPAEYDQSCNEVAAALLAMRDPESGQPVVARVWRRDELYHGPCVERAPDLILDFAMDGNYSYTCLPSHMAVAADQPVRMATAAECAGGKLTGMSGSHRRDGLFVLSGAAVAPGAVHGADLTDMTPTILALCGLAVPDNLDGRVLSCLEAASAVAVAHRAQPASGTEEPYSADEARAIERRLQALGYLA